MAQLTAHEQEQLRLTGTYVRERCDHTGCARVIGSVTFNGKGNKHVYCSRDCRDEEEHQPTKLKVKPVVEVQVEPIELRDYVRQAYRNKAGKRELKPRKLSADKVLGVVKKGTTIGNMLTALLDGEWHTKKSMESLRVKEDDSIGWRLTQLERLGAHALREYKLQITDDKVKLTFLGATEEVAKHVKVTDVPSEE